VWEAHSNQHELDHDVFGMHTSKLSHKFAYSNWAVLHGTNKVIQCQKN